MAFAATATAVGAKATVFAATATAFVAKAIAFAATAAAETVSAVAGGAAGTAGAPAGAAPVAFTFFLTLFFFPLMAPDKLITNYETTVQDRQLPLANAVIAAMKSTDSYPDGEALAAPVVEARAALVDDLEKYPHPDPSQTAARNVLRHTLLKALGALAIAANLRYTGNAAALLSTELRLTAAPQALAPPAMLAVFNLVDGEQEHTIDIVVERADSNSLVEYRYTTDPTLDERYWEACTIGADRLTVAVPEGAKLRAKAAEVNRATRPNNVKFTAVKSRIGQ